MSGMVQVDRGGDPAVCLEAVLGCHLSIPTRVSSQFLSQVIFTASTVQEELKNEANDFHAVGGTDPGPRTMKALNGNYGCPWPGALS